MLAIGVCLPQTCSSTGNRFAASKSSFDYCRLFFLFGFESTLLARQAGTKTDGDAVTRKPGSAWLEGTPAMDHGINGKRIHM